MQHARRSRQFAFQLEVSNILKSSTIHGLSHVSSATSRQSKVFWLILVLAGIGGFTANLVFIVERYLSNPVLTTYTTEYEPFQWPDITFCNPSAPIAFSRHPELKEKWYTLLNRSAQLYGSLRLHDDEHPGLIFALSSLNPSEYFYNDFQHVIAVGPYADVGKRTIDRSIEFLDAVKALPQGRLGFYNRLMFSRYPMPCYTFQASRYTSLPGFQNLTQDLRQVFFAVTADFESYGIFNSDYIYRGVFLHLSHPDHLAQGEGYLLLPGFNNFVSSKMSRIMYHKKKRNCRDSHFSLELYDALLLNTKVYQGSYLDCKHYLSQRMYLTRCQCYNPFLPIFKTAQVPPRLCLNMTLFNGTEIRRNFRCLQGTFEHYNSSTDFEKLVEKECGQFLRPECEHTSYSKDFRTDMWIEVWSEESNARRSNFLYQVAANFFNVSKNDAFRELRKNIAYVFIQRYAAHGDLVKEEPEYPLSELISDVGGLMGLWLGLSVVGLFELVEILQLIVRFPRLACDWSAEKAEREQQRSLASTTRFQEVSLDGPAVVACPQGNGTPWAI